jgi:hypothetical protein
MIVLSPVPAYRSVGLSEGMFLSEYLTGRQLFYNYCLDILYFSIEFVP